MTATFILPGGIVSDTGEITSEIEIDQITGYEEDVLADSTMANDGSGHMETTGSARLTKVLSSCTVRIGDLTRPDGKTRFELPSFFEKIWENAFTLDRSIALLRLRILSLGKSFIYPIVCPSCRKTLERVNTDLTSFEADWVMPNRILLKDKVHTLSTVSGYDVKWKTLTGRDEDALMEIRRVRTKDTLTSVLMLRCVSVNGRSESAEKYKLIREMPTADRIQIRDAFPLVEGKLEMPVDLTCPNTECRLAFKAAVDTSHRSFFFPSGT